MVDVRNLHGVAKLLHCRETSRIHNIIINKGIILLYHGESVMDEI